MAMAAASPSHSSRWSATWAPGWMPRRHERAQSVISSATDQQKATTAWGAIHRTWRLSILGSTAMATETPMTMMQKTIDMHMNTILVVCHRLLNGITRAGAVAVAGTYWGWGWCCACSMVLAVSRNAVEMGFVRECVGCGGGQYLPQLFPSYRYRVDSAGLDAV